MTTKELELKFNVEESEFDRFSRSRPFGQLIGPDSKRPKITSSYFDTAEFRLGRAGVSLQIRRVGEKWLQTIKVGHGTAKRSPERAGFESFVTIGESELNCISDHDLGKWIQKIIKGEPLESILQASGWPTEHLLELGSEGIVELAIDRGEVLAGKQSTGLYEVELALREGSLKTLLAAPEKLIADQLFQVSKLSTAERGYAVLGSAVDVEANSKAVRRRLPALRSGMSEFHALAETARPVIDEILTNGERILVSDAPEYTHQLRVNLRRLRTALKVFKSASRGTDLTHLSIDARNMGRVAGELRDADVLVSEIYFPAVSDAYCNASQGQLLDILLKYREQKRAEVRSSFENAKWSRLKLTCTLFEEAVARELNLRVGEGPGDDVDVIARRALDKAWKKVRLWGKRLDELSIEERHEMRKDLKSLRYSVEFFVPLYRPKQVRPFVKKLKELQDVFGYLNDVATAERIQEVLVASGSLDQHLETCAAHISDWHRARSDKAWKDARSRWNRLSRTPRFWLK